MMARNFPSLEGKAVVVTGGASGIGEAVVRAVAFLSLPLYSFPLLNPGSQVVTASVMAGVGVAGLGLVVVPQCAMAWMVAFTFGVGGALLLGAVLLLYLAPGRPAEPPRVSP